MPALADLQAEKAKMRRNIEALYGALGTTPELKPRPSASPLPAAIAAATASPAYTERLPPTPLRTMDRTATYNSPAVRSSGPLIATAVAIEEPPTQPPPQPPPPPPPLPPTPSATAAKALSDSTVIELTGELQVTRGALEAERSASSQLNHQLAEMAAKVARMAAERDAEKTDAQRAAAAQRQAEEEARDARIAQDDALRRLHAMQQEMASERYAHELAVAEARAERDAVASAAQRQQEETLRVTAGSSGEARTLRAEAAALRDQLERAMADARAASEASRRTQASLEQRLAGATAQAAEAEQRAERVKAQAVTEVVRAKRAPSGGLAIASFSPRAAAAAAAGAAAGAIGAADAAADPSLMQMATEGVASADFLQAAMGDLDRFARELARQAKAHRPSLGDPDVIEGTQQGTRGGAAPRAPPSIVPSAAPETAIGKGMGLGVAEQASVRAQGEGQGGAQGGGAPATSAAAAAALVRVAELEATVAELRERLQQHKASGTDAVYGRLYEAAAREAKGRAAARAEGMAEGTQRTQHELHTARERMAAAERRVADLEASQSASAHDRELAIKRAEQHEATLATEKSTMQRLEEELRAAAAAQQAEAEAARREAAAAAYAKATAEARLADQHVQLATLEAERREWRTELDSGGQRVRELEEAVAQAASEKAALERSVGDLKENAERRALEALKVREMSREASATAAARPSVELLKENERLRREVLELRGTASRRASEVAAAMASRVEEIRMGHRPPDEDEERRTLGPPEADGDDDDDGAKRPIKRTLSASLASAFRRRAGSPARAASPRRGGFLSFAE